MLKNCDSCANKPEFSFFSPTTYAAVGFCCAFEDDGLDIYEVEKDGEEGFDYVYDGKKITDCPCWELEEEEVKPSLAEDTACARDCASCPSSILSPEEHAALDQLWGMIGELRERRGYIG